VSGSPAIAIDGPSGSGKGTVSRRTAQALGYHLLDSGALYRLVALAGSRAALASDDEQGEHGAADDGKAPGDPGRQRGKEGHDHNGLGGFFLIRQAGQSIEELSDRRRQGQDVAGHHDQAHLHGELQVDPETLAPGLYAPIEPTAEVDLRVKAPDKGHDVSDRAQDPYDHQRVRYPFFRPVRETRAPVLEEIETGRLFVFGHDNLLV